MMLYTEGAKTLRGMPDETMESFLTSDVAKTNEAFVNSDISLYFNLVYAQQVRRLHRPCV